MSTGENIKRIRNIRGMTQKELGIAVGIGEESAGPRMAQYETGKRTPKEKMLNKIAEVLNMSALELFNKIDGNVYVNNSGTIGTNIGVAKDCSTVRIEAADDLRELIKANSRLIDMLHKRIEFLENKMLTAET